MNGKRYDTTFLHIREWLECIRQGKTPSCNIDQAFEEAITAHMGTCISEGRTMHSSISIIERMDAKKVMNEDWNCNQGSTSIFPMTRLYSSHILSKACGVSYPKGLRLYAQNLA